MQWPLIHNCLQPATRCFMVSGRKRMYVLRFCDGHAIIYSKSQEINIDDYEKMKAIVYTLES